MRKKSDFKPGDLIAIPLRDGRWGVGVIARRSRGAILYCYFMPQAFVHVPDCDVGISFRAHDAVLSALCSALGLRNGQWKRICALPKWRKEDWPLPPFANFYDSGLAGALYFRDDQLHTIRIEERVPREQLLGLPSDDLRGYKAMEFVLTKSLIEHENTAIQAPHSHVMER